MGAVLVLDIFYGGLIQSLWFPGPKVKEKPGIGPGFAWRRIMDWTT
jgi:hypothetical protein